MTLPTFLTRTDDGEILLTDHRIGLFHLVQNYNEGESAEMLASRYPTLPLSLVHKVIAFYLDNHAEIDAYVSTCSETIAAQRRIARPLNLTDLRQRLSANGIPAITPETQVH